MKATVHALRVTNMMRPKKSEKNKGVRNKKLHGKRI